MAEELVHIEPYRKLSDRVHAVLGLNPSKFSLQGTNAYIVGTGKYRILIGMVALFENVGANYGMIYSYETLTDAAQGIPEFLPLFRESLVKAGAEGISDIIITHRHHDHTEGIPQVLEAIGTTLPDGSPVRIWKRLTSQDATPPPYAYTDIADKQVWKTEGATLTGYYTPGHSDDHFTLILDEENACFTGDNVLGQGTTVFEQLGTYLASLRKTADLKPARLYPAHGPIIEQGTAKIEEYIHHRQERENQIVELLQKTHDLAPATEYVGWTSMGLVKVIYAKYPVALHLPAERSLLQHMDKLVDEGRVTKSTKDNETLFTLVKA
ncbi:hypothetical protein SmJEL517_g03419 [Synchytrium microbalum]|uniref:Metallo-beta-lactamase domain-containing protein n=1 Tax=Synchytrium microbalum TaxID=1806994 RepID=A0A507C8C2_9FUNG|nr:uncharacterized protein SmJEL517_g03419 [Synchytrium microbalum]TPX33773.1 hypothetical protein SmJEL517_g03419 [Synchytrium microbalum]